MVVLILRSDRTLTDKQRKMLLDEIDQYGVAILESDWRITEVGKSDEYLLNVLRRRVRSLKEQRNNVQAKLDNAILEISEWVVEANEELKSVRKERDELKNKLTTTGLTSKDLDLATKLKYGNVAAHNLSFSYDTDYGTGVNMSFRFREGSHEHENYLWKSLKERMV